MPVVCSWRASHSTATHRIFEIIKFETVEIKNGFKRGVNIMWLFGWSRNRRGEPTD